MSKTIILEETRSTTIFACTHLHGIHSIQRTQIINVEKGCYKICFSKSILVVNHIIYDFRVGCHLYIAQQFKISLQVATLILPSLSIRNHSNHRNGTYFGKGTTKEIDVRIIYQSEGYCRKLYIFFSNLWYLKLHYLFS